MQLFSSDERIRTTGGMTREDGSCISCSHAANHLTRTFKNYSGNRPLASSRDGRSGPSETQPTFHTYTAAPAQNPLRRNRRRNPTPASPRRQLPGDRQSPSSLCAGGVIAAARRPRRPLDVHYLMSLSVMSASVSAARFSRRACFRYWCWSLAEDGAVSDRRHGDPALFVYTHRLSPATLTASGGEFGTVPAAAGPAG